VIERLDRVEALHLAGAPAGAVVDELRALVSEAEDWLAAEGPGTANAASALERCRSELDARQLAASA